MERDAQLLWENEHLLPDGADIAQRLHDLCACAYVGSDLIGVTTAAICTIPFMRSKLAVFRCAISETGRKLQITSPLTVFTRELLENWSRENPKQEVSGLLTVVLSRELVEQNPWAINPETRLALVGYTSKGYQIRAYWFAHARISKYWPGSARNAVPEEQTDDPEQPTYSRDTVIEFRPAWRRRDPAIERDTELFWQRTKALPPRADVTDRLANLCAAAYVDGDPIAIATARIRDINFLRCKLAMYTLYVAQEQRSQHVGIDLTIYARDLLEAWSRANPTEEVLGMGAVIQSRLLVENFNWGNYPNVNLALAGYTSSGLQMRVCWFPHARVSTYWPGDPDLADLANEIGDWG